MASLAGMLGGSAVQEHRGRALESELERLDSASSTLDGSRPSLASVDYLDFLDKDYDARTELEDSTASRGSQLSDRATSECGRVEAQAEPCRDADPVDECAATSQAIDALSEQRVLKCLARFGVSSVSLLHLHPQARSAVLEGRIGRRQINARAAAGEDALVVLQKASAAAKRTQSSLCVSMCRLGFAVGHVDGNIAETQWLQHSRETGAAMAGVQTSMKCF